MRKGENPQIATATGGEKMERGFGLGMEAKPPSPRHKTQEGPGCPSSDQWQVAGVPCLSIGQGITSSEHQGSEKDPLLSKAGLMSSKDSLHKSRPETWGKQM